MVQVILFVMFAVFAHTAQGACVQRSVCLGGSCSNTYCLVQGHGQEYCSGAIASVTSQYGDRLASTSCPVCDQGSFGYAAMLLYTICGDKCEADSLKCEGTFIRDEQGCRCVNCQPFDTTIVDNGCSYDNTAGKYLNYKITRNCHVDTCGAVNQVTCSADTVSYYSLTCDTTCNENSEITCMGSIDGVNVYLRGCNGKVTKCEADGSCDFAMRKVANGECENPNDPPNPNSSSGSGSSSSQAGSSSGTGEDWEWLKDSLHVIHIEEMETNDHLLNFQPFITGTYDAAVEISGTTHDINNNILTSFEFLNDIKENTYNTANNTNNINSKLTNTNQLLTDLNNKSWNMNVRPEITVEGDTTIVNVQTDTAHSGAAILDFLKGMFSGADTTNNYNPNDTAGMGDSARHMLDGIAGMGDTVPNMHDSLAGAVQSYKNRFDSVGAQVGRITGDSLASWNNKLLNNGVLQGNGSNSCPSILNTPFEVHIGTIDYTTTKTIGMYLCTPISPFNVTLWTLARVILRAVVSIACMWALYRCVLGINEDED